ncbi:lytic transglycosylase domain-containing protein [Paenibacillus shirakamiensis]|uniref:lytic transglycosylase domain-containing protein n=1 Tax=Paenibacillus shirakamiensis TaxID=1265935 RepID=UPI001AE62A7D
MQIDPRTAKQLIQLQMMNSIDLQGTALQSASTSSSEDSSFNQILQQMVNSTSTDATSTLESESTDLASVTINGQLWQLLQAKVNAASAISESSSNPHITNTTNNHAVSATAYDNYIKQASTTYGVPESLIKAVIDTESSFDPNSLSSAGAKGLMQLMDGTAQGLGVSNSFDPAQNIDGGTKYIAYQLKRYNGNISTAMAAYNAGPGTLQKLGITNDQQLLDKLSLLPKETQKYITKIARAQAKYEV